MNDVKEFVEKMLANAKDATTFESVLNFRAHAFGVIMFAQKFIPYEDLEKYWEDTENGMWFKFNDIAKGKNR
jgi:hypothetical protein